MPKFRVLYKDSSGQGRFQDVDAKSVEEAVWNVAGIEGEHAEYVDSWQWRGEDKI